MDLDLAALAVVSGATTCLLLFLLVLGILLQPGGLDFGPGLLALQSSDLVFQRLDLFLLELNDLEQSHDVGCALRLGNIRDLRDGQHGAY